MTDTKTEIITTKQPKKKKSISQTDLEAFKDGMIGLLDERLDIFIDDFLEAWQESNKAVAEAEEKCSCPECSSELPENPARYILFSGGQQFPATDVKPNPIMGIDFYFREVDPKTGKEHNSKGTITSADVVILDLQPEMTLEMFSAIKSQTMEYVIQKAQEAKAQEEALKASQGQVVEHANHHVSYN